MEYQFIADAHVGKLAKLLRLLGFDTLYSNEISVVETMEIARQQNRMLLTRNRGLKLDSPIEIFVLSDADPEKQLEQVYNNHLNLAESCHPFSRCIVCNGMLESIAKEKIMDQIPPKTAVYFTQFWQCKNCGRVYWKGSHYERMNTWLAQHKMQNLH